MIRISGNMVFQSEGDFIKFSSAEDGTAELRLKDWNTMDFLLNIPGMPATGRKNPLKLLTNLSTPVNVYVGDQPKFQIREGKLKNYSVGTFLKLSKIFIRHMH
jgi:hypothetical protein